MINMKYKEENNRKKSEEANVSKNDVTKIRTISIKMTKKKIEKLNKNTADKNKIKIKSTVKLKYSRQENRITERQIQNLGTYV